ncbi:MAG: hypothetical protein AAB519_02385 [Patescibacteria group bacterium]
MSKYAEMGVDATKGNVRKIFGQYVQNDFPGAFVNIVRDPSRPGEVFTQHMDGDGSKFVERLLIYRETENPGVIRGAVDDALSMNMGDIAASGFVSDAIVVTDVLNVNGFNIPKDMVMEQVGSRFGELLDLYRSFGFQIYFLGGETADLPDQVQTAVFDVGVNARANESDLIFGNVRPGDFIWGFASDGRANWESEANSGIMSNGLTLARRSTMWNGYTEQYPDLIGPGKSYLGSFRVGERADPSDDMSVDQMLISPTRQWAILIKVIIDKLKRRDMLPLLHGISMNTGGGATKIAHVGTGIVYHKVMPTPPRIFQIVKQASEEGWQDMFTDLNCGIGIDIVGHKSIGEVLREAETETGIILHELGTCKSWKGQGNRVELETPYGTFRY